MNEERTPGFYWCHISAYWHGNYQPNNLHWVVCYWDGNAWLLPKGIFTYYDTHFAFELFTRTSENYPRLFDKIFPDPIQPPAK